ncbi:hypothetical protein A3A93_05495 [Candidatus Roizmanbacteria bacterium RIFCSPLOWO2_01_FULL_38_12]|uniref:GH18 domain-containing protein n=1 Tax=Candidatus Roizmanbacteria bacterium RIFCSPLOWO2_01_FULL_38_12 TaxID=1802061 RepID=A0A1F7IZ77_9BACT|nr:MAG: hypothetical protein A2861_03715 [Candidatus Roizmanbacteria bacterium RIFCSPHIGHO2_01_FULL_38_15]OGK35248.1 MAG: hypothetical protein A3F59_06315 [Candidatus Roizmanbacteria bacterium RIFCSPHIGHO2_12_FULL_38_13]OGK48641.1 MAG: hypothetical protein A3A93_05495 [Candidatus Roizmanbacteria bacterium RIFCSPLOWO2_01_FULL_38_12]
MRKVILIGIILLTGFLIFGYFRVRSDLLEDKQSINEQTSTQQAQKNNPSIDTRESIFVPYWSVNDLNSEKLVQYEKVIYFGVSAKGEGIDREESGFIALPGFVQFTQGQDTYLTLRMLDTESNLKILEDPDLQEKIIADLIDITDQNRFDGVVLDLELSVLPFGDVKENISMFVSKLSEELHERDFTFLMTIYGDKYFRGRPYDINRLNNHVDEFMIMAYDFHKSYGEPGPNFPYSDNVEPPLSPLLGKEGNTRGGYGYDFKQMIEDFTKDVPTEKLTVVFGMFGYDWTLGKQGLPLKQAAALSLSAIRARFYPECDLISCAIQVDEKSKETKISYIDDEGNKHQVWFEDENSAQKKIDYLNEQGIGKVAYWAWGYW